MADSLNIKFEISDISGVLKPLVEENVSDVMAQIADDLPAEIQRQMADSSPAGKPFLGGRRSAIGQPPALVTRSLCVASVSVVTHQDHVVLGPQVPLKHRPVHACIVCAVQVPHRVLRGGVHVGNGHRFPCQPE